MNRFTCLYWIIIWNLKGGYQLTPKTNNWKPAEQKLFLWLWPQMSVLLPCSAHLLHLCYSAVRIGATPAQPVHLLHYCAMTEELTTCELTPPCSSGDPEETLQTLKNMEINCDQPIFSALSGGGAKQAVSSSCLNAATSAPATSSDTESGIFSAECELCVEHESELDWFCGTEQKLICSQCASVGSCLGHTVTPLSTRVTALRVSVCVIETEPKPCAPYVCF